MVAGGAPKIVAILPARYASERFPGKVIAPLAGRPLVMHTYERTLQSRLVSETVIATDDARVVDALAPFDANVVMTGTEHTTGTDRIAEVARTTDADIVVNVQADEPLVDPNLIDAAIQPLIDDPDLPMATARHRIQDESLIADPNCVKVVCDLQGHALYFSRHAIPFVRDAEDAAVNAEIYWQHVGLYVFRKEFLLEYAAMVPTPLEKLEKLEQLRVLENGYEIAVVEAERLSIGVDTPADLERAEAAIQLESSA